MTIKKYFFVFLLLFIVSCLYSQNVQEVISAERNFAKMSREKSTRAAFLDNLAADAVLFAQGQPVNGQELWQRRKENNSLLDWWPVFADISIASDLGYTTGPFKFFNSREEKNPTATGYYSTIWKKQPDGAWKVVTDIGIGLQDPAVFQEAVSISTIKGTTAEAGTAKSEIELMENSYHEILKNKFASVDQSYLAKEFRVHRNLVTPITMAGDLQRLNESGKIFLFERTNIGMSGSGDLAYTLGKVKISSEKTPDTLQQANYMRVWKNIDGKWMIILDVIGN
jgi:ketosteroid isomerase-like protein